MARLRLMSHNQWKCDSNLPAWEEQGLDCSAEVRERGFVRVFRDTMPDVIGCQEVSAHMADLMIRYLREEGMRYALLWGRDTPIVYRQDKFELIDSDFALYPKEFPGYEGEFNNGNTKSWCLAVFRVKENGKLFLFVSTHLWWKWKKPEDSEMRVRNARELLAKMDELQAKHNCPVVGGGDLNSTRAQMERGFVTPLPDWEKAGFAVYIPPRGLCTDNAVMIGSAAMLRVEKIRAVAGFGNLILGGIFTHFSCADTDLTAEDTGYTAMQLERYRRTVDALEEAGVDTGIRHAANSAAILGLPEAYFDAVRAGIILYGLSPSGDKKT